MEKKKIDIAAERCERISDKAANAGALRELASRAIDIIAGHEEAAGMDAGFDAGEFSAPAHGRAADEEIAELAKASGFSVREIEGEMMRMASEGELEYCAQCNGYGSSLNEESDRCSACGGSGVSGSALGAPRAGR